MQIPGRPGIAWHLSQGVCTFILGTLGMWCDGERGFLQPGGKVGWGCGRPGRCQQAGLHHLQAPGLGQSPAWKCYVGGFCHAWARPHFVYSFDLLFYLTIYSWLPFSHGGCVYLAHQAWSPPGSCCCRAQP